MDWNLVGEVAFNGAMFLATAGTFFLAVAAVALPTAKPQRVRANRDPHYNKR